MAYEIYTLSRQDARLNHLAAWNYSEKDPYDLAVLLFLE
jgi:hypothetical protein